MSFWLENKIVFNFKCCLVQIVTAITEPFVNKMRAFPDGTCHNILRSQPDIPSDAYYPLLGTEIKVTSRA